MNLVNNMFQVVKDIISSVSIEPNSDTSSSDTSQSSSSSLLDTTDDLNKTEQPKVDKVNADLDIDSLSLNLDSAMRLNNGDFNHVAENIPENNEPNAQQSPRRSLFSRRSTQSPVKRNESIEKTNESPRKSIFSRDSADTLRKTKSCRNEESPRKSMFSRDSPRKAKSSRESTGTPRRLSGRFSKDKPVPAPETLVLMPEEVVDEYLNKFLESIVRRFYEHKPFEEYSKVRDYNFGNSKLELLSKYRGNSNLKEFIVNGEIDVPMENLLALVMEIGNRTIWDDTYLEHEMISFDEATKTDFIYSVSKYPFPLTKRTYVVTRTCYNYGEDCLVILSAATTKFPHPKKLKWATQVDEFESLLVVKNFEPELVDGVKKITRSYMLATYFENPKVLLPNSYLNLIIGQLVPGILSKMVIASKKLNYQDSVDYVKTMKLVPIPK
ncbi:lipid-binding/transfer protein, putative [Theileria annulata]|uniref:Lipid-binding/transfer protein, putative n=1 Tax=Theileria annulata TaxID=5874 RepID=Q4UA83_THEAN|nr:lipid-binding/transfer protein, putative [Theileria annulata]CAI76270.1 lipid-binding/transfer protein, putative [Theileria annulata]|eukprot:XP_952894.1 lipid-binding/transfer protein, putative [Theileria annulata]